MLADDEFTEVPRSATLNVGGTFTQKCRHQFGWVYSWHSSRGPLNNGSRSKVRAAGEVANSDFLHASGTAKWLSVSDHQ